MGIEIRARTPHDLPALVALLDEGGYPPGVTDRLAWLTARRHVIAWVAVSKRRGRSRIIGHSVMTSPVASSERRHVYEALGLPLHRVAIVSSTFVEPRMRFRGIGGSLLQEGIDLARAHGYIPVLEYSRVEATPLALALAQRRGWEIVYVDDTDAGTLLMVCPDDLDEEGDLVGRRFSPN